MISESELLNIIEGFERDCKTLDDCEKLAVYYTVYDHLFGKGDNYREEYRQGYSMRMEEFQDEEKKISVPTVTSDFLRAVEGMDTRRFWGVIDELVSTIEVINPRLYEGLMKRLEM